MRSNTVSKKELERIYLDRFAEIIDDFPQGNITHTESPDFVLEMEQFRLGIEVTELYWKTSPSEMPRQARESINSVIANKARSLHVQNSLPNCQVSIHFTEGNLKKKDTDRVANSIFEIIEQNLPDVGVSKFIEPNEYHQIEMPPEVAAIHVFNYEDVETFYGASHTAWIPDLQAESDVQTVINLKNLKVKEYSKKAKHVWLLINIGFGPLSSEFDVPHDIGSHSFSALFERVYLFHQSHKKCYLLNLKP